MSTNKPITMVNRGAAGLLKKLPTVIKDGKAVEIHKPTRKQGINLIDPALASLAVPIDSLKPDPSNANLHPEDSIEAITESLQCYGQLKPIVVRKSDRVIAAGNGTWTAAKKLGWTQIAAALSDNLEDVTFYGYALADNRTAQKALWDFEQVAKLEKLLAEKGEGIVGWSDDEIIGLRIHGKENQAPLEFISPEDNMVIDNTCPKCGWQFSGQSKEITKLKALIASLSERVKSQADQLSRNAMKGK